MFLWRIFPQFNLSFCLIFWNSCAQVKMFLWHVLLAMSRVSRRSELYKLSLFSFGCLFNKLLGSQAWPYYISSVTLLPCVQICFRLIQDFIKSFMYRLSLFLITFKSCSLTVSFSNFSRCFLQFKFFYRWWSIPIGSCRTFFGCRVVFSIFKCALSWCESYWLLFVNYIFLLLAGVTLKSISKIWDILILNKFRILWAIHSKRISQRTWWLNLKGNNSSMNSSGLVFLVLKTNLWTHYHCISHPSVLVVTLLNIVFKYLILWHFFQALKILLIIELLVRISKICFRTFISL